jgi:hypothetical protein
VFARARKYRFAQLLADCEAKPSAPCVLRVMDVKCATCGKRWTVTVEIACAHQCAGGTQYTLTHGSATRMYMHRSEHSGLCSACPYTVDRRITPPARRADVGRERRALACTRFGKTNIITLRMRDLPIYPGTLAANHKFDSGLFRHPRSNLLFSSYENLGSSWSSLFSVRFFFLRDASQQFSLIKRLHYVAGCL